MTRQVTGQGPLRPPPGHVLQCPDSHNPPNHPRQPSTTSTHTTHSHQAPNELHQLRTSSQATATPSACTHPDDQLRAPTTQPQVCPLGPRTASHHSRQIPTTTARRRPPNYNSHPMHLRCKQRLTKPFIFSVQRVNILFTFEAKPLNLERCLCKRRIMAKTPKTDRTTPIAFRLSDDKQRRLTALASAEGLSSGEYARELVLTKIDEHEIINQEVQQLRAEFQVFRSDFALAVEALLVAASNNHPLTAEQARQWVDDRIRRPSNLPRKA